jgi:hypothetical protein
MPPIAVAFLFLRNTVATKRDLRIIFLNIFNYGLFIPLYPFLSLWCFFSPHFDFQTARKAFIYGLLGKRNAGLFLRWVCH